MLNNKYTRIYNNIIYNALARTLTSDVYTERHHIIPKSIGGSNDKTNLVKLTAREHFICHWLLTKMTLGKDKAKMMHALNGMRRTTLHQRRYTTKITARVYAKLRGKLVVSDETKMKISVALAGRKLTNEHKQKLSIANQNPSDEIREIKQAGQLTRILQDNKKICNPAVRYKNTQLAITANTNNINYSNGQIQRYLQQADSDITKQRKSDAHKGTYSIIAPDGREWTTTIGLKLFAEQYKTELEITYWQLFNAYRKTYSRTTIARARTDNNNWRVIRYD